MAFSAKVISTQEWGARRRGPFEQTIPKYIVIHHTASGNPPSDASRRSLDGAKAYAREVQRMHIDDFGFSDSGHNFLNTTGGFLLEGRTGSLAAAIKGRCVRSAHTGESISNRSPGIENEGNFMDFDINNKQWESLIDLCASLCESCGIHPSMIKGHRDFTATLCPGDRLYAKLPQLRQEVANRLEIDVEPTDLLEGSQGPAVKQLQERLRSQGFNPGPIDGIFGDLTEKAVRAFQQAHGLEDDGVVGPRTREKLDL